MGSYVVSGGARGIGAAIRADRRAVWSECNFLAVAVLFMLQALDAAAGAPAYAEIRPRASKSLLLDIVQAGERIVAVGERGHILYSDDDGGSWRQARVPTVQLLTAAYFVDAKRGWAVGHDGMILVTDDAGVNWRLQRDGLAAQADINLRNRERAQQRIKALERDLVAADEATLSELEMQMEEAVMDLEDAGWALEEPPYAVPLMDVWFEDRSSGWAVGAFGTLLSTSDGGQTWSDHAERIDNPDEFHLNAITGDGSGRIVIAGEAGVLYATEDGGENWRSVNIPYQGSWFGIVHSKPTEAWLVFGLRGHVYRADDLGARWHPVDSGLDLNLAGGRATADGHVILVGGVGAVARSEDGGRSFEITMMPDRLGLSSVIDDGNGAYLLVGQGGVKPLVAAEAHPGGTGR